MKISNVRFFFLVNLMLATTLLGIEAQATPQVKNSYIVKFSDEVSITDEVLKSQREGIAVKSVLKNVFKGFVAEMNASQAAALSKRPHVEIVELDQEVSISVEQSSAPWGLDRIDQTLTPLSTTYNYSSTGSGITAYVLDTGIRSTHIDFSGRVGIGFSSLPDKSTNDCHGHGTHVAATIGGVTYGVAKNVTLIPVRVLDCNGSGSISGIISGLDWVASVGTPDKSVVNMSLGGGISRTLDSAVNNLIRKKVVVVAAAGNSNQNACNFSPARVASAITVGATDSGDSRAYFSNFGSCLDLFAPGVNIASASSSSDTGVMAMSGTSMAAPHASGIVARYLSTSGATAGGASSALVGEATQGLVKNAGAKSPNRLLYRNAGS